MIRHRSPEGARAGGHRDEDDLGERSGAVRGREAAGQVGRGRGRVVVRLDRLQRPGQLRLGGGRERQITPRSGERYIGGLSVTPDSPQGLTLRFGSRQTM